MPRRTPKTAVVAFKVEQELADLLNKLPNKSAFIRKAIAAQLGMSCPLCRGKGVVSRGVHDHFAPNIAKNQQQGCASCGCQVPFPLDDSGVTEEDGPRMEQFFLGGPLYCEGCYEKVPECHDCGWHVSEDLIPEHMRHQHNEE